MRQSDLELDGVVSRRTALAGLVVFAVIAASTLVLFLVRSDAATEVRGEPGTTWISGEARGRVVLAAAGGDRPSVAVEIGAPDSAYDVVDLGGVALVQDRGTGEVTVLNGGSGVVVSTFSATPPTDDRPVLVSAGTMAYLVDPIAATAREISADGVPGEPTDVGNPFTDWVGTADGRLWLLNTDDGSYSTVAGGAVDRQRLTDPGADLVLSAVGGDPVVLDRDNSRLRWLRRDETVQLDNGSTAVLQDADTSGSCVHVLTVTEIACYGPEGALRSAEVDVPADVITGAHVFGNRYNAVVTWPTQTTVYGVDWRTEEVTPFERLEPSERPTVGWSTSGPLLIDDPGSRYSFSLDRGRPTDFDKFSRRSVVLGPDGSTLDGGVGELDDDAETVGRIVGPTADTPPPVTQNDDGRNDPPEAADDTAVTRYGRDVTINVLANDIDPDGDVLVVTDVSTVRGEGEVEVIDGSQVIFSPTDISADERTTVTFDYTIADPSNLEDTATVTVEIRPEGDNEVPVTADDEATTLVNTPVDVAVLSNDTDGDGDPLTISELSEPANGSAAPTGTGEIRYEPDLGFTGSDRFEYTVIDGFGGEAVAEVRIEVLANEGERLPPDAVDDRASVVQGQRVRIPVLENDTDPDGGALTVVAAGPLEGLDISIADGQFIDVTPGPSVAGLNSFKYTIEDSDGLRDTATVALVVGESLDRPPRAVDDRVTSAAIAIPVNVLANDVDPDGDPLAIIAWTQPDRGGSVNRASPSTLQFTPSATFRGTATFSYTISDPSNNTSTAKVIVQVIDPIGSGPVARDDTVSVFVNEKAVIPALANDSHPDGLPFSYAGPPTVREGSATINADNTITYTPPADVTGTYTLSYAIQDAFERRSTATITVSVVEKPTVNRAPVTVDDLTATQFQTPVLIDVLANDSDPDAQQLQIGVVGSPGAGRGDTAIVSNQVRYSPPAGFSGLASFSYTATDGIASTSGTVLVQVTDRVKVAPIAVDDLLPPLLTTGTTVAAPLLNDSDPDGPNNLLQIKSIGAASGLAGVAIRADGVTLRITAGSQTGTFTIPYTIVDSDGLEASATVTVTVQVPPNVAPIAIDDFVTTPSVATPINVMGNDVDPDGGTLSLVSVTQPAAGGTATIVGSGIVFKPATGFIGVAQFTYTIRDPEQAPSTATVTVTVTACAQPVPALSPDIAAVPLNGAVNIPIFANDAQPLGHLELGRASSGSASLIPGAPGQVHYAAATNFSGTATFSYTVSNDCDIRATATVSVDVNPAPTALNDAAATPKNVPVGIPVLANDVDLFNDPLTIGSIFNLVGGTATVVGSTVTFTPAPNFTGNASFTYTALDPGNRSSNPATVVIAVSNRAPVVQNEQGTMLTTDASFTHPDVLANDIDPDLDPLTLGPSPTVIPAVGTASVSGGSITFTPSGTLTPGPIEIHYTVSDNLGASAGGVLTIVVLNQSPIANDDSASGQGPIDVVQNDSDPDPGQEAGLAVAGVTLISAFYSDGVTPASGTATSPGQRFVAFNPDDPAFAGTVVLDYTLSDGFGGTATGRVTITFP